MEQRIAFSILKHWEAAQTKEASWKIFSDLFGRSGLARVITFAHQVDPGASCLVFAGFLLSLHMLRRVRLHSACWELLSDGLPGAGNGITLYRLVLNLLMYLLVTI